MTAASQVNGLLVPLIQDLHLYNLLPRNGASQVLGVLCKYLPHFCEKLDDGFYDWNDSIDNKERFGDKAAHSPSGAGWRNLIHYAQIIKSKNFQRYDYGKA